MSPADASVSSADKLLPVPGETFDCEGRRAFLLAPAHLAPGRPWVWYAPTLPAYPDHLERWLFERLLERGIAIAGIDVGESYGSPAGVRGFDLLWLAMTRGRGYGERPLLLGRSRGGLQTLAWAIARPGMARAWAGIYPVCDIRSYPSLERAAPAYELSRDELERRLGEFNPVDRAATLVEANVPLLAIHGDADELVPIEANSRALQQRVEAAGGAMTLHVASGHGHDQDPIFFQNPHVLEFLLSHANEP